MTSKIEGKFRDHAYRTAFVASQINIGIPFQIKALMKTRGWTQEKLAERTGMLQPRISAILKPGKVRPNIETLRRLAEAFDCGLLVRFAPFSELACWSDSFDPERFDVPAFEDDPGFKESEKAMAVRAHSARLTGLANARLEDFDLFRDAFSRSVGAVRQYLHQGATGLNFKPMASYVPAQQPPAMPSLIEQYEEYMKTSAQARSADQVEKQFIRMPEAA